MRAKIKLKSGEKIDYVYLPHPNDPIRSDARRKAWEFCFSREN